MNDKGGVKARLKCPVLAMLAFHKIGQPPTVGWESWNYIPDPIFGGYLSYIRENGWQVIDVADLLRGLTEPDILPERALLLSFDDGYRSMREVALPWLQRFGYPGVLFVPTSFIGGSNTFDAGVEPEEAICDWEDLLLLERHGVSVQSHGVSHRSLSGLDPVEREAELVRSKSVLESGLGKPVEVFAFPYGDGGSSPMASSKALRQAGYRAACLYGGGPTPLPIADKFRLPRVAMGPDTDLSQVLGRFSS